MTSETKQRLTDVIEACRSIETFIAGRDYAAFERNDMLQAAVERKLKIIGEAFVKLEILNPELSQKIPELRKIIGLRNRIIHGYDSVDDEIIWDIAKNKTPALRQLVETLKTN
jgi:uncharacterized protein with HEPN domain